MTCSPIKHFMDKDDKFWLAIAALICITVLGISVCFVVYYTKTSQTALQNGYEDINGSWIKRSGQ